jgi:hypothetical protein
VTLCGHDANTSFIVFSSVGNLDTHVLVIITYKRKGQSELNSPQPDIDGILLSFKLREIVTRLERRREAKERERDTLVLYTNV